MTKKNHRMTRRVYDPFCGLGTASWWWLLVALVLSTGASYAEAALVFQPFANHLGIPPCADGSAAGIYVEEPDETIIHSNNNSTSWKNTNSNRNPRRQLIVFIGGGACTSAADCIDGYAQEPFKFSSALNPTTIQGDTILSNDPNINDALYKYQKTLVPYCSQDLFLGAGRTVANLTHAGAAHMEAALTAWRDQMTNSNSSSSLESVVVVGLSAGAIGVLNHVDMIRDTIVRHHNSSTPTAPLPVLRILLDSPNVLADRPYKDKDFREFASTYVDLDRYPFCNPLHPYSRLYTRASALPCCLSPHCMLRHHPSLVSFYDQLQNASSSSTQLREDLLLLDSAYDTFSLLAGTSLEDDNDDDVTTREEINDIWSMIETAGARKKRAAETTSISKVSLTRPIDSNDLDEPHVRWIFTSCVTHTFLVPSREFLFLSCKYGDYRDESFNIVCNEDGFAMEFQSEDLQTKIRIWRTVETWRQVDFQGRSMRSIISEFVSSDLPSTDFEMLPVFAEEPIDFRLEDCAGPNCLSLDQPDEDQPSCQALVELDSYFQPVPTSLQAPIAVLLILPLAISLFVRVRSKHNILEKLRADLTKAVSDAADMDPAIDTDFKTEVRGNPGLKLSGIVSSAQMPKQSISPSLKTIVKNADLELVNGTVTAIAGRIGSGKSTLLKSLSQRNLGYHVSIEQGGESLANTKVGYLRQEDTLMWVNLKACDLFLFNAWIFKASEETTSELFHLLAELFDPHAGDKNPFFCTPVAQLSGGQRRLLSASFTLLMDAQLVLLDEPLSGLDAFASLQLVRALKKMAVARSVMVLMVAHQPSERILSAFDQIVIMDSGQTICRAQPDSNNSIEKMMALLMDYSLKDVWKALRNMNFPSTQDDHESSLSQSLSLRRSSVRRKTIYDSMVSRKSKTSDMRQLSVKENFDDLMELSEANFFLSLFPSWGKTTKSSIVFAPNMFSDFSFSSGNEPSEKKTKSSVAFVPDVASDHFSYASVNETTIREVPAECWRSTGIPEDRASSNQRVICKKKGEDDDGKSLPDKYNSPWMNQAVALLSRLHAEEGWSLHDMPIITAIYVIMACLLLFEKANTLRVLFMAVAMVSIPTVVFVTKSVQYARIWTSHRLELDDRLVDPLSFQIAAMTFYFALPILGIFVATIPVYLILGWSFETYLVQVLFTVIHLVVTLQLGRVVAVYFRGSVGHMVTFLTFFLLFCFLFSSFLLASWKLPPYLRWVVLLSMNFWGFSGAIMSHFDDTVYDNSSDCNDFVTCLLSDGRFIVRFLGFGQLTNQYLSFGILCLLWLCLIGAEYVLLRLRRR